MELFTAAPIKIGDKLCSKRWNKTEPPWSKIRLPDPVEVTEIKTGQQSQTGTMLKVAEMWLDSGWFR